MSKESTKKTAKKAAAKKSARKVAKKTAKKATAKKTAKRSPKKAATKAVVEAVPELDLTVQAAPSYEQIQQAAYLNYLSRLEKGTEGSPETDWQKAEQAFA